MFLFSENGKKQITDNLKKHLDFLNFLKVGEIFVNSIDLEGTMLGPDNQLIKIIKDNTELPIIYSGGIGTYDHIKVFFNHSILMLLLVEVYLILLTLIP